MSFSVKNALVGLPAAVLLVGVAGCSGPDQQGQQLPKKDRAEWVMPLDDYIPDYWHLVDYAENLAVVPCMSEAGYDWKVPWQDPDGGNGPSMNASERKLFNPSLAQDWGYHQAPRDDPSLPAWRAFVRETSAISQEEHDTLYSCLDTVRKKKLPALPGSAQLPSSLEQAAYEAALQDKTVVKAAAKWHACMLPQGVADLPDSPEDMPSPSLRKQFSLDTVITDDSDLAGPKVSPEEIKLASADAECRESSGWAAKLYDSEWRRHLTAVKENADALAVIKQQIAKYKTEVLDVISANAPSAP